MSLYDRFSPPSVIYDNPETNAQPQNVFRLGGPGKEFATKLAMDTPYHRLGKGKIFLIVVHVE
jgi:hypothetical protein